MTKLLLLILYLLPFPCLSQQNEPDYYLNGLKFIWDSVFVSPKSIKSITVKHNPPNGEIFILMKDNPWKYNTLSEVLKTNYLIKQINDPSIVPVFIVDGKVVNDTSVIKIDKAYYSNITLKSISKVIGITKACRNIVLVDIQLAEDPNKFIRIRGEINQYLDSLLKIKK